jgi:hypothetical protein
MSQWLLDNKNWIIPGWFGGLMLITLVRWALANRQHDRDDEVIRRIIERRLNGRREEDESDG